MKKLTVCIALCSVALVGIGTTVMAATSSEATAAQQFVTEASEGGHAEVALGKLASEKGSSNDVKSFGELMQKDHGRANQELAALASRKGWEVASAPDAKLKATEQRLSRLNGDAFDRAYMQEMVKDHEKDVRAFEQAAKQIDDAELGAWIDKTLPTLRQHLDRAKELSARFSQTSHTTTGSR